MYKYEQISSVAKIRCKTHGIESKMFCAKDQEYLCLSCIPHHLEHFDRLVPGSTKDIHEILDRAYLTLQEKSD